MSLIAVILLSPYENRVAKYAHTYIYIPKKTKKIEGKTRLERKGEEKKKKTGGGNGRGAWALRIRVGPHVKNARST